MTFLIVWTFSSHQATCLSTTDTTLYCRLSPHTAQPSPHTADATLMVLHTFSPSTSIATFLIMQRFSSHHTSCFPTAGAALLILYTFSSQCTTSSSYCRHDNPGTAHFLSSYCRYDIPDAADFLLTPQTLSYYCRLSNPCTVCFLLTLYNLLFILQMQLS